MGDRNYECTPWGSPAYNIFGWQKPCYLLAGWLRRDLQGVAGDTKWEEYGVASGNPKCANCMVSCGYEPTAVIDGFGTLEGILGHGARHFSHVQGRPRTEAAQRAALRTGPAPLVRSTEPRTH